MKIVVVIIFSFMVIFGAIFLMHLAQTQPTYEGIPTVACVNNTKQIFQTFSLHISITILDKPHPLDAMIGHDNGNCLHDIFTNDASGTVFISSNDIESFTLGQFFDVWHKTFSENQIFSYQTDNLHKISVVVNEKHVTSFRDTLLSSNQRIEIVYR